MAQQRRRVSTEDLFEDDVNEGVNQPEHAESPPPLTSDEPITSSTVTEEARPHNDERLNTYFQSLRERISGISNDFRRLLIWMETKFDKKYHCPYCFERVYKRNVRIEQRFVGSHISRDSKTKRSNLKPISIPYCTNCGNSMPADYFKSKSTNIAVIGGVESGKSTYITVLIDLLLNHKSIINDLEIDTAVVEGKDLFQQYSSRLIDAREGLGSTSNSQKPIILKINRKNKTIFLSLFDTKGEEFTSVDGILSKHPHVDNADAILFLINPLSIRGVFKILKEEFAERYGTIETSNDSVEIIQNIHDVFSRKNEKKYSNKPLQIPVVFGISRADEIEDIANIYLPDDSEEEFFDFKDSQTDIKFSSDELEEFLVETEPRMVATIRRNYSNYRIFPVSPTGCRLGTLGGSYYEKYEPKGVLNPILWIFSELKFI